jgi:hypothetical protein
MPQSPNLDKYRKIEASMPAISENKPNISEIASGFGVRQAGKVLTAARVESCFTHYIRGFEVGHPWCIPGEHVNLAPMNHQTRELK